MTIDINDPRLTAYALGELDTAEAAEIAAILETSTELQEAVRHIRETATLISEELSAEPAVLLTSEQRQQIDNRATRRQDSTAMMTNRALRISRWLLPAAACVGLGLVVVWMMLPSLSRAREASPVVHKQVDKKMPASLDSSLPPIASTLNADNSRYRARAARKGLVPVGYHDFHESDFNTEAYDHIPENAWFQVRQTPLSTFSIDVDTASYANVRRFLNNMQLPPPDAVRIEEMINYFEYEYPQPQGNDPFSVNIEIASCPWNSAHRLARIGLKGLELAADERPPANLVFLLDVSGSMRSADKLPLLKQAMKMLTAQLQPSDSVAIVVYAGASGLVLPATYCEGKAPILDALDRLAAGGSTNGGAGIQLAYDTAVANFIDGGINRVILATDGDFNVGITDQGRLIRLIQERAADGVFLSVLGFGTGNLKDSTMEKLADKGNGNYSYIDSIAEAHKVLVKQLGGTLVTIAKDVKIQVEFNPAQVNAYRLIGYENRLLRDQEFNDDTKDAGEIGAGHTVTALYEIVPVGVELDVPSVDPLKYQTPPTPPGSFSNELMTVKLRYKEPDGNSSKLLEIPAVDAGLNLDEASDDFAFQAAVAAFGLLLRDSGHSGSMTYAGVIEIAQSALGEDPDGYRTEFVQLVQRASYLQPD